MKRITVLLLIMIMVLTSAGSAFAVDNAAVLPIEARLYTGGDEPLISVAVPESITARSTLADPTVLEYDTITIENFASSVQIDSMSVTPESGYTLLADDSDFSIAGKSFSMVAKFGDMGTEYDLAKGEAEGKCEPKCVVYRDSSLDIDLSGHFSPTQEAVNAKGATLTLTLSAEPTALKVTGDNLTFQVYSDDFTGSGALEYSTDGGKTWEEYSNIVDCYYEESTVVNNNAIINASSGTLYIRGSGIEKFHGDDDDHQTYGSLRFIFGGRDIQLSGNIEALRDWETVDRGELPAKADYAFCYLFGENTGITDASNLLLSRTDLSGTDSYYYRMFARCTSLTAAPNLPATKLGEFCYGFMFSGCTALTTPPALPATVMTEGCYSDMFSNCTSLNALPALPATELHAKCYGGMFYNCSSIKISEAVEDDTYVYSFRVPQEGIAIPAASDAFTSLSDIYDPEYWTAEEWFETYSWGMANEAAYSIFYGTDSSESIKEDSGYIDLGKTYYTPNRIIS